MSNDVDSLPFSSWTLSIFHVPEVCAPTVNTISIPVVAADGIVMFVLYRPAVEDTVNVPVAIWVRVGLANVPKVFAVFA
jgi:hypothetical protein